VLLEVRDDGCGMDDATRSRLFEPYFTTKGQGRGTGLGLSSSYGIVKECGGTIDVISAKGMGTTFFIHFPRVHARSSSGVQEVALRTDFPRGSETILVVEDESDVRDMAVEVLESMGYQVLQAGSGAEALQILANPGRAIDVLLSDVIMPGMSGGELVKRAKSVRPGLRVIYMSGYTAEDSLVRHGVEHAEASYLQKPFSLEALSRKVRDTLDAAPAAGPPGRS
jgi:CheY-like chemotaxis protein